MGRTQMMNYRLLSFLSFMLLGYSVVTADDSLALGAEVVQGVGQDWSLPDGQIVNLQIIGNQFHLVFLDPERLIIEPTIEKVIVRGEEARNKTNELNLVLRGGSGTTLTHPRKVSPPHDYWLRLLIPKVDSGDEWESLARLRFRSVASE